MPVDPSNGIPLAGWPDTATLNPDTPWGYPMRNRKHTYIATIWQYTPEDRSHTRHPVEYNLGADLNHARERARDLLPVKVVEGTGYTWGREQARADHVAIRRREVRRDANGRMARVNVGRYEWFLPEVQIVPSVGELGWTP